MLVSILLSGRLIQIYAKKTSPSFSYVFWKWMVLMVISFPPERWHQVILVLDTSDASSVEVPVSSDVRENVV